MKKLVNGLVGIVFGIGCLCSGCQPTINEEAKSIIYHYNAMRKVVGLKQGETLDVYDFKEGNPLHIIIRGDEEIKSIIYFDMDKDGEYDKKNTLKIPKKLDILGVFPDPNTPKDGFKKYIPEKRRDIKKDKRLFVYNS